MNQDWHEWRSQGIGASDAGVIHNKYHFKKTPYMLWEEKLGYRIPFNNKAMRHGNDMEPRALRWTEAQFGMTLISQQRAQHAKMPWMRATLDGIDERNEFMVEIKCAYNLENHYKVKKTKTVPDIYLPQVQHQMKVKEMDKMYFVSYNHQDEKDSIILEVLRDNKYIDRLVDEEYEFFQYVVNRTPPPLTDKDYEIQGEEWIKIAKERKELKELISHLEKKDRDLYEALIELSGNENSSGGEFKFTKIIEKGRIDYNSAIAHYTQILRDLCAGIEIPSIDLESFRKDPIVKWRLS